MPKTTQESQQPGGARRSQEEPEGARRSQEEPGGARRSQEGPGGARRGQERPRAKDEPSCLFSGSSPSSWLPRFCFLLVPARPSSTFDVSHESLLTFPRLSPSSLQSITPNLPKSSNKKKLLGRSQDKPRGARRTQEEQAEARKTHEDPERLEDPGGPRRTHLYCDLLPLALERLLQGWPKTAQDRPNTAERAQDGRPAQAQTHDKRPKTAKNSQEHAFPSWLSPALFCSSPSSWLPPFWILPGSC